MEKHLKSLLYSELLVLWFLTSRRYNKNVLSTKPKYGGCRVCRVLSFVMFWFWIYVFVSCLVVSCFDIPWPSVSFKFLLCSPLWLPLSVVLFPPGFLLCAPPPRYHTWPSPSSLSSPVPRWFISVCVFSLWFELCFWVVLCPFSFALCLAVSWSLEIDASWFFVLLGSVSQSRFSENSKFSISPREVTQTRERGVPLACFTERDYLSSRSVTMVTYSMNLT